MGSGLSCSARGYMGWETLTEDEEELEHGEDGEDDVRLLRLQALVRHQGHQQVHRHCQVDHLKHVTRDRTHVTRDTRGGHLRVDQRHGRRAVCRHVRQAAPPLGQLQQEVVLRGRVLRTSQFILFVMCKCVQMSYNGDAKTCRFSGAEHDLPCRICRGPPSQ